MSDFCTDAVFARGGLETVAYVSAATTGSGNRITVPDACFSALVKHLFGNGYFNHGVSVTMENADVSTRVCSMHSYAGRLG